MATTSLPPLIPIAGTCEAIDPPLIQVKPQHHVACHLWPEEWEG